MSAGWASRLAVRRLGANLNVVLFHRGERFRHFLDGHALLAVEVALAHRELAGDFSDALALNDLELEDIV